MKYIGEIFKIKTCKLLCFKISNLMMSNLKKKFVNFKLLVRNNNQKFYYIF